MKNNILFLLHLPPPVHGSSVVGLSIKESEHINQTFEGRYINLLASKKVDESGNVNIRKLFGFVGIWLKLLGELMKQKPTLCYFAPYNDGGSFLPRCVTSYPAKTLLCKKSLSPTQQGSKSLRTTSD